VTLGRPFKAGTLARIFHLVASRRLAQTTCIDMHARESSHHPAEASLTTCWYFGPRTPALKGRPKVRQPRCGRKDVQTPNSGMKAKVERGSTGKILQRSSPSITSDAFRKLDLPIHDLFLSLKTDH